MKVEKEMKYEAPEVTVLEVEVEKGLKEVTLNQEGEILGKLVS